MAKKQYLVSLTQPLSGDVRVQIAGRERKFGKSGHSFILNDAGEAREMNEELGKRGQNFVVVSEIPAANGAKSVKYELPKEKDKRAAFIRDGWVEVRTGVWRKGLGK